MASARFSTFSFDMRDRILIVLFCVLLIGVPLGDVAALAILGKRLPLRPFGKPVKDWNLPSDIWNGKAMVKFERAHLNHSLFARGAVSLHNELFYQVFRRPAPRARLGKDGWLTSRNRVREIPREQLLVLLNSNVEAIASLSDYVEKNRGKLMVAIVPDRVRLYSDKFYPEGRMPSQRMAFLGEVTKGLRARGVHLVDLLPGQSNARRSGETIAYADDHHWTSAGARVAASDMALAVDELLPRRRRKKQYELLMNQGATSEGSLLKNLGFYPGSALEESFRGKEDRVSVKEREKERKRKKKERKTIEFSRSCATLWTTSFGRFGSPEFLANELGCPVRVRLGNGKGSSFGPAKDLPELVEGLNEWALAHPGQRYPIVWEIPEYHLISNRGAPREALLVKRALQKLRHD